MKRQRLRTVACLSLMLLPGALACMGSEADLDRDAAEERQADTQPLVPAGTEITFHVTENLSTSVNHKGDMFEAVVAHDVAASDGRVLIPAGSLAQGEVIEASRGDGDTPAVLAVRIRTIQLADEWLPLDATMVSADLKRDAGDTASETAGKIAIGAAAGALIGQVLGKSTESTLAGAGVGTIAGAVVALTSRAGDATLHEGSQLRVRLDAPVPVR
jgi:hypothetical protein